MDATMGVDPGTEGGIAVLAPTGQPIFLQPLHAGMPEEVAVALVKRAVEALHMYGGTRCFYEKVGYMPTDGGKGAFTFGRVDGLLRGALLAMEVKPRYILPSMWQSAMECLSGGNKNVTKRRAQQIFPSVKLTHNLSDALLIAEFGRRRSVL